MSRRLVLAALSAVLALVVAAAVWLTLHPPGRSASSASASDDQRVDISTKGELADINEMTVESPKGRLRLRREGEEWRAEAPTPVRLDKTAVEDLGYTFTRLYSEKIVEKEPQDLKVYGLDPPIAVGRATLKDGTVIELRLGNRTPAGNTYYLQKKDDPTVYAVWMNHGEHLQWTLKDVRDKKMPSIDAQKLKRVYLSRRGAATIEIVQQPEGKADDEVLFSMGLYRLVRPYSRPYAVDTEAMMEWLRSMPSFAIEEFVADNVSDWTPYGLARPSAELFMQDEEKTLHLLFGDRRGEAQLYFRVAGERSVYTMRADSLEFLQVKPFRLVDKFAFIVNIDDVDSVRVQGPDLDMTLSMQRTARKIKNEKGEEIDDVVTTYFAQGKQVTEDPFKKIYQSLIGLFVEGENTAPKGLKPEVTMTYTLNKGKRRVHTIQYSPHDADFYEVIVNGRTEFLISREQIRNLLDDCRTYLKEHVTG